MGLGEWYHNHVAVPWEQNVAAPLRKLTNDYIVVPLQEEVITPIKNYWTGDNTDTTADDNTKNQAANVTRVLTPDESITEWNARYNKLINQIAGCESMEERRALVNNHREQLIKFKDSNLAVDNDLAYLKVSLLQNSNQQQDVIPQTFEQYQAQQMREQGSTKIEIDEQERRNIAVIRDADHVNGEEQWTEFQGLNSAEIQKQIDTTKVLILDADSTDNFSGIAVTATPFKDTEDLQRKTLQQQAGYTPEEIEKTIQAYKYLLMDIKQGNVSQDDPAMAKTFEEYQKGELLGRGYSEKDADQKMIDNQNLIKDGNLSKADAAESLSLQAKYGTKAALGYQIGKMAIQPSCLNVPERVVLGGTAFLAAAGTSVIASEAGATVKDFVNGSGSKEKEKVANDWKENSIKNIAWSNVNIPGMEDLTGIGGGVLKSISKDGILKGVEEIKSRFHFDGNASGENPPLTQEQQLNFHINLDGSGFTPPVNSLGTQTILQVDPKIAPKAEMPQEFQLALELMKASTKFTNQCIAAREEQNTQSLGQGLGYSRGGSR